MTKRHYEQAARIVQTAGCSDTCQGSALSTREVLIDAFVAFFTSDNTLFDEERFRRACEPGANVRARA